MGTLETWVFNWFPSYSHQICVGPRSKHQSIFDTLWFLLWPPGGQIHLFLLYIVNPRVFNWAFSNSHHTFLRPRPTSQEIFSALQFHFRPLRGQVRSCMSPATLSFQPTFPKISSKCSLDYASHSIFLSPFSYICGHQGAKCIFLVCALQPLVFNRSFPNSHQIFIGPISRLQYLFITV